MGKGGKKAAILRRVYKDVVFGIIRTDSADSAVKAADAIVGACTVLDAVSARMAIDGGSRFLVCPALSEEVIKTGNRYGVPVMPGIGSVSELVQAMEWGADVVKLFPGTALGPQFIKALVGPVPQARVIPVGGVEKDNLTVWLAAGAFALGLGKALTHPDGACTNAELIKKQAREILQIVAEERKRRSAS